MSHQSTELLPCPFCGGAAICVQVFEKPMPRFGCSACGMFKLSSTAWNTRSIASVKREPLSEPEIINLADQKSERMVSCFTAPNGPITAFKFSVKSGALIEFVRAIEKAHGITATTASREDA